MSKRTNKQTSSPNPPHLLHHPSKKEDSEQILVSKRKRWKNVARIHFTLSCPLPQVCVVACRGQCPDQQGRWSCNDVFIWVHHLAVHASSPPHPFLVSDPQPCTPVFASDSIHGLQWHQAVCLVERYENIYIDYITCTEVSVCVCVWGVGGGGVALYLCVSVSSIHPAVKTEVDGGKTGLPYLC